MIKSMTGYGRGEIKQDGIEVSIEIKSVNHRYLDFYIRLPKQLNFMEDKIRTYVSKVVSRGKCDIFITYENFTEGSKSVLLDSQLAKAYIDSMKKLRDDYGLIDDISTSIIARFPDILKLEKMEENEERLWKIMESAVEISSKKLIEMREIEGKKLKDNILEKLILVEGALNLIRQRAPEIVSNYKEKLRLRFNDLVEQGVVDESRLAAELVIFADKCSIDEEIVRLDSHITQVREILEKNYPIGRKLDFMIQEMNREINTIGSKANDLLITNNVVDVKTELEKIREQIQNIE